MVERLIVSPLVLFVEKRLVGSPKLPVLLENLAGFVGSPTVPRGPVLLDQRLGGVSMTASSVGDGWISSI